MKRHPLVIAAGLMTAAAVALVAVDAAGGPPAAPPSPAYGPALVPDLEGQHGRGLSTTQQPTTPTATLPVPPSSVAAPTTVPSAPAPLPRAHVTPEQVSIPSMQVNAEVKPVGLDTTGGVAVPEDILQLGWYRHSARLGSTSGSMAIVGHRDSAVAGAGALFGIEDLKQGDQVIVRARDGTPTTFVVNDVRLVEKANFADIVHEAFGRGGPFRLTLITCGGEFDYAARSYLSNVIVTARPADSPSALQ